MAQCPPKPFFTSIALASFDFFGVEKDLCTDPVAADHLDLKYVFRYLVHSISTSD